nr:alpha-L-arabinofuranosidase C-terminal domain-containing protein [Mesorhizobium sp. WSM3224]
MLAQGGLRRRRTPSEEIETVIDITGFGAADIVDYQAITHADMKAVNSAGNPNNVRPRNGTGASVAGSRLSLALPPYSYQMIRLKL